MPTPGWDRLRRRGAAAGATRAGTRAERSAPELDLGEQDIDAEMIWGANMTLRRRALARAGRFDPALSGQGDEEDWLRHLRVAGGRIRYLAKAGVDHRRAGRDARIPALTRAG